MVLDRDMKHSVVEEVHSEPWLRQNSEVVGRRMGDEFVLIHLRTNQIYVLSRTSARFWELIDAGYSRMQVQRALLKEFEVTDEILTAEIEGLISTLKNLDIAYASDTD